MRVPVVVEHVVPRHLRRRRRTSGLGPRGGGAELIHCSCFGQEMGAERGEEGVKGGGGPWWRRFRWCRSRRWRGRTPPRAPRAARPPSPQAAGPARARAAWRRALSPPRAARACGRRCAGTARGGAGTRLRIVAVDPRVRGFKILQSKRRPAFHQAGSLRTARAMWRAPSAIRRGMAQWVKTPRAQLPP